VGEKRFDNIIDLVQDGLITFYIEKHASNYIAIMADENNYAESPYVASRTALLARQKRSEPMPNQINQQLQQPSQQPQQRISPQSIHSSFQRQHQHQMQQQLNQLPAPHQHSTAIIQHQHSAAYPQSQQQQQQHQHTHHQQQQQQQQSQQNSNNNGTLLSSHQLFQQQQYQQSISNSNGDTNSSLGTISSQLMDKENRQHFNTNTSSNSELSNKFTQQSLNSLSSAKSNAIFDRFDIMNSEKPHRFKVLYIFNKLKKIFWGKSRIKLRLKDLLNFKDVIYKNRISTFLISY
jgi:hypothetical protein